MGHLVFCVATFLRLRDAQVEIYGGFFFLPLLVSNSVSLSPDLSLQLPTVLKKLLSDG